MDLILLVKAEYGEQTAAEPGLLEGGKGAQGGREGAGMVLRNISSQGKKGVKVK